MAWVDCMRWRRMASVVRGIGWAVSGLLFLAGVVITFGEEGGDGLATFALFTILSVIVLGVAHGAAWAIDKRGDRLVTR